MAFKKDSIELEHKLHHSMSLNDILSKQNSELKHALKKQTTPNPSICLSELKEQIYIRDIKIQQLNKRIDELESNTKKMNCLDDPTTSCWAKFEKMNNDVLFLIAQNKKNIDHIHHLQQLLISRDQLINVLQNRECHTQGRISILQEQIEELQNYKINMVQYISMLKPKVDELEPGAS